MPPIPRRNVAAKPRYTYGRERSVMDQDEATTTLEENEDQGQSSTISPLKRMSLDDVSSRPANKRMASGAFCPTLSGARQQYGSLESNDQGGILKAPHELQEAGNSHRIRDEIEYVLDGVKSKGMLKVRRASCLDLVRSMLKPEFAAHIKMHHYMPVIFESTYDDHDPDTRAIMDMATIRGLIPFLCRGLEVDIDPMAITPTARQEIAMFNDFKDVARQSGIIRKGQKVLIKSITLENIAAIVRECVSLQDEDTISAIEQDPTLLSSVIDILIEDLAWIKQSSFESDVSLPDVLDIDRVENCLDILERIALVSKKPAGMLADNPSLFHLLVQLVTLCRIHAFQHPQRTDSLNLMLHVLRLLINVTNRFEPCSTSLADSGLIQVLVQNFVQFYHHSRNYDPQDLVLEPQEWTIEQSVQWAKAGSSFNIVSGETTNKNANDSTLEKQNLLHPKTAVTESGSSVRATEIDNDANGWYDILLLSLGLLINILEISPHCREHITHSGLDCMAIGSCLRDECQCEKSTEALERLVQIYNTEAIIGDMTDNQALAAHLALLIGCIVEGSAENETRLYQTINGHSLEPMLELLHEFVATHKAVHANHFEQYPNSGLPQYLIEKEQDITTQGLSGGYANHRHPEGVSGSCGATLIAEKAAKTEQSFLRVISILQSM
ncbi:hypothetical protein BGX31_004672, partial [Mortierella sp. GBA43]